MQQMHQSTATEQLHIYKYIFSIPNETIPSPKETDVMAKLPSLLGLILFVNLNLFSWYTIT